MDYHAKLTIHNLPNMTTEELETLIVWFDQKAEEISSIEQEDYNKVYTSKLMK